ncbi:hypothetical protein Clacol_002419 [Clathrus columnatus]|uniref:RING-type domain-containing protein n=1 Tax=Clathrus columnatus TaxID=1419009 RepID=A0AAV5A6N8_9AGAM|nr:hypothetical protein Clacol_002419 [Clathrus columnatus]
MNGNVGQTVKNEDEDDDVVIIPDEEVTFSRKDKDKGKGKAVEVAPLTEEGNDDPTFPALPENLLSTYICPICLSTVTNACLTPCGHVLCGLCLFSAVKSGIKRGLDLGIPLGREGTTARCPVCRANLKGWDGKGAGVIPLRIRTITAV